MAFSRKDKQGLALLAILTLVVGALVFAVVVFKGKRPKADEFGCSAPVFAATVIVLDHSEQMTEQTRNEISARALDYVENSVLANERVTVFNVSEVSKKSLIPAFSGCKLPRDGNRLIEAVATMEKNYRLKFLKPLTEALNVKPGNSKESPLAQALIDISLTQYLRGEKNSLLVFSDMLEHVPGRFTMYPPQICRGQQTTIKTFRDSRNGATERPTFKNTTIRLNIVPRTDVPRSTIACRDQLWPWFFGDNQGSSASLIPDFLPGI